MRFLITGDLVVDREYKAIQNIHHKLIERFKQSDCNIVNLEAPITNSQKKIIKTGPYLKAHQQSTIDVLKALNIHVAALANNHIKDYDEKGVIDTLKFCEDHAIEAVGAGTDVMDAARFKTVDTREGTVAIINIAENEWSTAEEDSAGANGMCLIKDIQSIQKAKRENDFVFVIVHGGHEYHNLPSPRMQRQYRFYAEQGADLVVGHHTHCISGYEIYSGTPIYYSLGNFLFTRDSAYEDWYVGAVLQVDIVDKQLEATLIPVVQEKGTYKLQELDSDGEILFRIAEYNKVIQDKEKLADSWTQLIKRKQSTYLTYWSAKIFIKNRYISALVGRTPLKLTSTRALSYFLNLMRCEAHSDLSRAIIKENLKP